MEIFLIFLIFQIALIIFLARAILQDPIMFSNRCVKVLLKILGFYLFYFAFILVAYGFEYGIEGTIHYRFDIKAKIFLVLLIITSMIFTVLARRFLVAKKNFLPY